MADNDHIFAVVKRCVLDVVPDLDPALIDPDSTLADLGCNSIDRADIVTMAMEELGVSVSVSEFRQDQTIGWLVEVLGKYA